MPESEHVEEIHVDLLPEPEQVEDPPLDPTDDYVEGHDGPASLLAARAHQGRPYTWSGEGSAGFEPCGLGSDAADGAPE